MSERAISCYVWNSESEAALLGMGTLQYCYCYVWNSESEAALLGMGTLQYCYACGLLVPTSDFSPLSATSTYSLTSLPIS